MRHCLSKQSLDPFPPPAQMQQLLTMPPILSCRVTRTAEQCNVVNYELNLEVDAKCCISEELLSEAQTRPCSNG